jgi:hypothetical protein
MKTAKRPVLISIASVLGFLWMFVAFVKVFSPAVKKMGMFVPSGYGLIVALSFIAWVGIWYMKRWGVFLLIIMNLARWLFLYFLEGFDFATYFGMVLSGFFYVLFFIYFKKMDRNL